MATQSGPTPAAIVIGLDSITGLQSARVLAARGIPVVGIASDLAHPSCRTRACSRVIGAPTSGDALIDVLTRVSRELADRPVLFPCTDLSVLTISRGRHLLDDSCRAILPAASVLECLVDKAAFHEYAVARGLPVANGFVLRRLSDLDRACAGLRFPCVMKPAIKTIRWLAQAPAKVIRCGSPAALRRAYIAHASWADAFVVQDWIDGPDTAHFTCNAYFGPDSTPVATFVSQKLRQWPIEGGVGCFSQECREDVVLEETVRLYQGVHHRGLAYLEMKLDARTGRHLIVEPNVGRPTGRSAAAEAVGVELLYTQYCDALGLPLPPVRQQSYGRSKWIYLRQDTQAAFSAWRRGQLTPFQWITSLRGCRRDAVFSWTDPIPFIADVARALAKRRDARRKALRPSRSHVELRPRDQSVDCSVHGIVGVRLRGASASDLDAVARQLGPVGGSRLDRSPDVTVRFVDEVRTAGARHIEHGRTAFTDNRFLLLRDGRQAIRAQLEFDRSGHVEIVCEHGVRSVPLLLPILSRAARARGFVALHASATAFKGGGVLMPAWAHGGKTTGLLAALTQGAHYVGDEWVLLRADGDQIFGVLRPLELHTWQRDQIPAARRETPVGVRLGARLVRAATLMRAPDRVVRALDRRLDRAIDATQLFGSAGTPLSARLQTVLCMIRHDAHRVRVERADLASTVRRIAASVAHDEVALLDVERAYEFAFPDQASHRPLPSHEPLERALTGALSGKDLFTVYHPSPCNLRELGAALAALCGARPATAPADAGIGAEAVPHPYAST